MQQRLCRCFGSAQGLHVRAELLRRSLVGGLSEKLLDGSFQRLAGDGALIQKGNAQPQFLDLPGGDGLLLHLRIAIMGTP